MERDSCQEGASVGSRRAGREEGEEQEEAELLQLKATTPNKTCLGIDHTNRASMEESKQGQGEETWGRSREGRTGAGPRGQGVGLRQGEGGLGRRKGRERRESLGGRNTSPRQRPGRQWRARGQGARDRQGPENIVLYIYTYVSHSTHQLTRGQRWGGKGGGNTEGEI